MEVVCSFESAVGWSSAPMPGQDSVSPGNDGVDDFAELGELPGGVEVSEAVLNPHHRHRDTTTTVTPTRSTRPPPRGG